MSNRLISNNLSRNGQTFKKTVLQRVSAVSKTTRNQFKRWFNPLHGHYEVNSQRKTQQCVVQQSPFFNCQDTFSDNFC